MITRMIIAGIGIVVGLAYCTAIKDVWDNAITSLISATPGVTSLEQTVFSAVPIALLVATLGWGILLIIKEPKEGGGGL